MDFNMTDNRQRNFSLYSSWIDQKPLRFPWIHLHKFTFRFPGTQDAPFNDTACRQHIILDYSRLDERPQAYFLSSIPLKIVGAEVVWNEQVAQHGECGYVVTVHNVICHLPDMVLCHIAPGIHHSVSFSSELVVQPLSGKPIQLKRTSEGERAETNTVEIRYDKSDSHRRQSSGIEGSRPPDFWWGRAVVGSPWNIIISRNAVVHNVRPATSRHVARRV